MNVITSVDDLPWEENDLAIAERVLPPDLLELTQPLARNIDQRFPWLRASKHAVVYLANGCMISVASDLYEVEQYGPYAGVLIGPFGHLLAVHSNLTADGVVAIVNEAAALPVVGHG